MGVSVLCHAAALAVDPLGSGLATAVEEAGVEAERGRADLEPVDGSRGAPRLQKRGCTRRGSPRSVTRAMIEEDDQPTSPRGASGRQGQGICWSVE